MNVDALAETLMVPRWVNGLRCSRCRGKHINTQPVGIRGETHGSRREDVAMMVSTTDILNLLRAKPWRFIEDIAGDELPMREGDDLLVFMFVNDARYPVTARIEPMEDLENRDTSSRSPEDGC